jgi:hypothetical protein
LTEDIPRDHQGLPMRTLTVITLAIWIAIIAAAAAG